MNEPWVLIAGGFHRSGGMDKANLALAEYLLENRTPIHLVAHSVDPTLAQHELVTVSQVRRPGGSFFLADRELDRVGRMVAQRVLIGNPGARVVVNGGNCLWGDINWVHSVHHAWPCADQGAPLWFRIKNRLVKHISRRKETRAIGAARLVVANSERTRRDLIALLGIPEDRVHAMYLGSEPSWQPPASVERSRARECFAGLGDRPLVVFVGALSYDNNKGFDTLFAAWKELCHRHDWDAHLAVAGSGNGLLRWKSECARSGLSHRMQFLGFTNRVAELLAAADLLVSPVRYEAYGLNVQEAICCGVPALVSASAGVAERYPADLTPMLLRDPGDVSELVTKLLQWRSGMDQWRGRFRPLSERLRDHRWEDMARQIVSIAREPQAGRMMSGVGASRNQ